MDRIELGQTGLQVSPLGLGSVKFGRNEGVKYPRGFEIPEMSVLADLLAQAKALGINMIDTAPSYGLAEERLGSLLKGQRADWVIVGKVGEEFENGVSSYHFTPEHFEESVARSLKRLRTDYIDILLIHSDGADMDILENEALIDTMRSFKERGMVRAIGASTKSAAGGVKTLELMDVVMASYNPAYIEERAALDYAARHGKGVLLKKLLSSGHNTDIKAAMHFGLSHPCRPAAIVGTINPVHLEENVMAAAALYHRLHHK